MTAYYNEIDPYAAQWLRNLIAAGHIAPGVVDERSIEDVTPNDLRGFAQCHFFAGIGVWSYALRLAGWPDDKPVWTGSCPCQPFSQAGKGAGFADERHLWPAWFHLIRECRPPAIFGEQVASPAGLAWLDVVQADLEAADYACGAVDLCAAGVGAPHIRQRLWFVAHTIGERHARFDSLLQRQEPGRLPAHRVEAARRGEAGVVGDDDDAGLEGHGRPVSVNGACRRQAQERHERADSFWSDHDLVWCRDGKWRPVEPGTFPLAHGAPARVGRLRAYGNAIVPQAAAEVVKAYMRCGARTSIG